MWFRILTTLVLFTLIFIFVSPIAALNKLLECNAKLIFFAVILVPVFVFFRLFKWFLLARQADVSIQLVEIVPHYLWGMAVGLVTPGRIGELVRLRGLNITKKHGASLFLLEKLIEVSVLVFLCTTSLIFLGLLPFWYFPMALAGVFVLYFFLLQLDGLPPRLKELKYAFSKIKITGCLFFSFLCFLVFCVQAFMVLKSMHINIGVDVIFFFPIILLGNFLPITVGGFGVRETIAIVILKQKGVPSEIAMGSITIVALIDLVLPALIGLVMNLYNKSTNSHPNTTTNSTNQNLTPDQWDVFWEQRKTNRLGRFIGWFRHRFVTSALIKYILKNTQRATLVEAGCGAGEVTLTVSKIRGDKVVLVDSSSLALSIAKQKASELGIPAIYIQCDIEQLSNHIKQISNSIVYNIGVIEHFKDCTKVLQEMDKVSSMYAIALIPEKSIFWTTYIGLAFKLRMVPPNFYIYLFDESKLRRIVEKAGISILWVRRLRIFGFIPYLGICFHSQKNYSKR